MCNAHSLNEICLPMKFQVNSFWNMFGQETRRPEDNGQTDNLKPVYVPTSLNTSLYGKGYKRASPIWFSCQKLKMFRATDLALLLLELLFGRSKHSVQYAVYYVLYCSLNTFADQFVFYQNMTIYIEIYRARFSMNWLTKHRNHW